MSNVLIGIVGVILFIGLALAGASFFGPTVASSIQDARSMAAMKVLSATAVAVSTRNRELETATIAAPTAVALAPDYMDEEPTNPVNGNPIMLITYGALTSGAPAALVVTKLAPTQDQIKICEYANRLAGGPVPVRTYSDAITAQRSGCAQAGINYGPFSANDYVMFHKI